LNYNPNILDKNIF